MITSVSSLKGGVGKSTIAVNLAIVYANQGKKVLAVDLDPQASLTDYFLRETPLEAIERANSYHFLSERLAPADCIIPSPMGVSVLPASPSLHTIGYEMQSDPVALMRYRKELEALGFDAVILDSPPSLSYEFRAALYSADRVLVPANYDRWVLQGLGLLLGELSKVEKASGRALKLAVVPSMISPKEEEELVDAIGERFRITFSTISRAAAIRRALTAGTALSEKTQSYLQFKSLAGEVMEWQAR